MTKLFIDIGNSRIKYALDSSIDDISVTSHADIDGIISCVIDNAISSILVTTGRSSAATQAYECINAWAHTHETAIHRVATDISLMRVNYAHPEQFGVDRFLGILAARQRYREHFCVVSAGTALTIDCYTDRHIGGMILPGLGSAQGLLAEKTALTTIAQPHGLLGNDTASCIGAGIYHGYTALVHGSIAAIANEHATTFTTVLTGGDAGDLAIDAVRVPELLFEGMREYQKFLRTDTP